MFPSRPLILLALLVCAPTMTSCASSPRPSTAAPPRLTLPATASRPCTLPRLPAGDDDPLALDKAYAARGAAIVACDQARGLAVGVLTDERAAIDAWVAERERRTKPRTLFQRLTPGRE